MDHQAENAVRKVPQVTFLFWLVKIAATTLGETAGDAVSMSMGLGYIMGTAIFASIFLGVVLVEIKATCFHPVLYWVTIITTTTMGTTLADFSDRSLGIGYAGGTALLLCLLIGSLALWYRTLGSLSIGSVVSPKQEIFYWVTIMFSQTLGTALGDWISDGLSFGYVGSAILFSAFLALLAATFYLTPISRTFLFWGAFVLTRPLGAVLGDFLDKPLNEGGLDLSRFTASLALLIFIAFCIKQFPQRAAQKSH